MNTSKKEHSEKNHSVARMGCIISRLAFFSQHSFAENFSKIVFDFGSHILNHECGTEDVKVVVRD